MSRTYPPIIPRDAYGYESNLNTFMTTALARDVATVTSSHYVALNSETTFIRVFAVAKDVYMKWVGGSGADVDYVNATNFDEMIIAGQYLDFAVPAQTNGTRFTGIQLVGRESGATAIVIEK